MKILRHGQGRGGYADKRRMAAIGLGLFAMLIHLPIDDGGSPRRPQVIADRRPAQTAASSKSGFFNYPGGL